MSKTQPLILNPTVIHCDELLTIKNSEGKFNDAAYVIQNESGSVIRKGSITISSFTFQLRIIGFQTGYYKFIMGDQQHAFRVI